MIILLNNINLNVPNYFLVECKNVYLCVSDYLILVFTGIIYFMNEILCCQSCGLMMQDDVNAHRIKCPRCYTSVRKKSFPIEHDLGLSIAGLIVFFPAMTLPIISFKLGESVQHDTMLSALSYFYEDGYPLLSLLVFFTSVLAPFLQIIISLFMLTPLYEKRKPRFMKTYFKVLYHLQEWIMLDVYVIAILVSVIKLTATSDVLYGSGLIMFVLLSSFSFLLSRSFSPQKIWRAYHNAK